MKTDVVAVDDKTSKILWVHSCVSEDSAEAVIKMAVMRQGVADRFFVAVEKDKYKAGNKYKG